MKRLTVFILYLVSIIFPLTTVAQDSLIIKGSIDPLMNGKEITLRAIYPYRSNLPNPEIVLKRIIVNGKFKFSFPASGLENYFISFQGAAFNKPQSSFLLMPGETEIVFLDTLLQKYRVTGNDINQEYNQQVGPLANRREFTQGEVNAKLISWIKAHNGSRLNTYILNTGLLNKISDAELLDLFEQLPDSTKTNSFGKELKFITENLYVGKMAPDFIQKDTSGVDIKLSTFRGKYVLIDFWASWCVPCRKEYPALIRAKKKFGKKGFEILGVSVDSERKPWVEAIKKDGLNWVNVSDLKGWGNEVSENYRNRSVPSNFLIDPQGKIIAKDLRGEAVTAFLEKTIR